jgi:hypothetical protein
MRGLAGNTADKQNALSPEAALLTSSLSLWQIGLSRKQKFLLFLSEKKNPIKFLDMSCSFYTQL